MDEQADFLRGMQAVANYLRVSRRTAYQMAERDGLPTFKLAGKLCARRSTLNAWLAEREAEARKARPDG